jgi:hypothetical protein
MYATASYLCIIFFAVLAALTANYVQAFLHYIQSSLAESHAAWLKYTVYLSCLMQLSTRKFTD